MKQLKANGSAQTRKTYRRHGITSEMFGVSYATLGKMKKKIKLDQPLAEQLWATGNHDARALASMIADPSAIKVRTLDAWAKSLNGRGMAGMLSNIAAEAPSARKQMEKWTKAKDEMTCCAGWHVLASMARQDNGLPDSYFENYLETIETKIRNSKNWIKYAMNNALINIGVRNPALQKEAIAAAKRIGTVNVDHGNTACKTPEAIGYIKKTVAHQKKMRAKKKSRKA